MSEPLNWPALVAEAKRRRRAEGLTQKHHAALAGVSAPTMGAFDRGATTLTLARAFDILRVVGLMAEETPASAQDAFVAAALARWHQLVESLPADAPARHPHGNFAADYRIVGGIAEPTVAQLAGMLRRDMPRLTGWPVFWWPTKDSIAPHPRDGLIECWLAPEQDRAFDDAAHSDFWRVSVEGRAFLLRGYQEDSTDQVRPGTIFDLTLPVWRCGEIVRHAARLAEKLTADASSAITVRVVYRGLVGRRLASWAAAARTMPLLDGHICRVDEIVVEVETSRDEAGRDLPGVLHRLLTPLYERFDFYRLPLSLVEQEVAQLLRRQSAP